MSEAHKWWRSLSINEMKMYEKKHKVIFNSALDNEIETIYRKEQLGDNNGTSQRNDNNSV